mgnify:CR=1 FL=1
MVAPGDRFRAAAIESDVGRYFTNVAADKKELPKTIEEWRERFPDKRVAHLGPPAFVNPPVMLYHDRNTLRGNP